MNSQGHCCLVQVANQQNKRDLSFYYWQYPVGSSVTVAAFLIVHANHFSYSQCSQIAPRKMSFSFGHNRIILLVVKLTLQPFPLQKSPRIYSISKNIFISFDWNHTFSGQSFAFGFGFCLSLSSPLLCELYFLGSHVSWLLASVSIGKCWWRTGSWEFGNRKQ